MGLTTAEKRRRLEDAWDATVQSRLNLRDQLRSLETAQGKVIAAGSVSSVAANARHTGFSAYGPGQITPADVAACYRELIDLFDQSAKWLRTCNRNGLDAFNTELIGFTPATAQANPAITIDDTGKWLELCETFSVDSTTIIGQAVNDDAVFLWMMDHLFEVTEARSDFRNAIASHGGIWL